MKWLNRTRGNHAARGAAPLGLAAAFAGLLTAGSACRPANEYQPPPPPAVTVAQPLRQEVTLFREFTGRTAPYESVEIRARVSGLLEKVHFEDGDVVDPNQLLYTIEQGPYKAALDAAEAELASAKAVLEQRTFENEKVKDLYSRNVASDQERVTAQAAFDSASARVAAAEAAVERARLDLGYTEIHSPIKGHANRTQVDAGNLVGHGEPTLLTTIVRGDPMYVYFTASERTVLAFRRQVINSNGRRAIGAEVFLRLADGTDYPEAGTIDYADSLVDPDTGTLLVRAVFGNSRELLVPGVFARVRFPAPPQEALLVPEAAVQRDVVGYFVLIVGKDAKVDRRDIEAGERLGAMRVVTAGLDGTERVIVKGLQRARPGIEVNAETTELTWTPEEPGASTRPTTAPATQPAE